jgi:hypothetical protein
MNITNNSEFAIMTTHNPILPRVAEAVARRMGAESGLPVRTPQRRSRTRFADNPTTGPTTAGFGPNTSPRLSDGSSDSSEGRLTSRFGPRPSDGSSDSSEGRFPTTLRPTRDGVIGSASPWQQRVSFADELTAAGPSPATSSRWRSNPALGSAELQSARGRLSPSGSLQRRNTDGGNTGERTRIPYQAATPVPIPRTRNQGGNTGERTPWDLLGDMDDMDGFYDDTWAQVDEGGSAAAVAAGAVQVRADRFNEINAAREIRANQRAAAEMRANQSAQNRAPMSSAARRSDGTVAAVFSAARGGRTSLAGSQPSVHQYRYRYR